MAGRGRTNPLALVVLALLHERPMHPYEMSTTLRERRKEESIKLNYGSLYAVVESLHKRELVAMQETVREGRRPERTVYAITEAGTAEMMDWLSDLVALPVKEYPRFEAALSLLPVLPLDQAISLLESRLELLRTEHRQQAGALKQAQQAGFPRMFVIEGEYQHALLGAEIDYVRTLVTELKEETFPGVAAWRRLHELRADGLSMDEVLPKIAAEFPQDARWLGPQHDGPAT
jgi:DNA-binding PadR family transcriptional regulator